jgi:hypothetical protein
MGRLIATGRINVTAITFFEHQNGHFDIEIALKGLSAPWQSRTMSIQLCMSYVSCIEAWLAREAIFCIYFHLRLPSRHIWMQQSDRAEQIKYTRKWNEKRVFTSDYAYLTGAGLFVVYQS